MSDTIIASFPGLTAIRAAVKMAYYLCSDPDNIIVMRINGAAKDRVSGAWEIVQTRVGRLPGATAINALKNPGVGIGDVHLIGIVWAHPNVVA